MSLKMLSVTEVERALGLRSSRLPLLSDYLVCLHGIEIVEITGSFTWFSLFKHRKTEWLLHYAKKEKNQVTILWTDHSEDRNKWGNVEQDRKKLCQKEISECSRHSDGHKSGAQQSYVLFIPVSCFRTVKPEGFKLVTFSASKQINA